MAKPKNKKTIPAALVITSEDAMIGLFNRLCELQTEITEEQAKHDNFIAGINAVHDEQMQPLRQELATLEASIQLFATNHRNEIFPDGKKSKDYANGTIGFRDNPFSVGRIVKGDTEETIALRLEGLEWGEKYIGWKIAMDKKALLRDRLLLTTSQLATVGIQFEQSEQFFITPNAETGERVTKAVEVAA